jgi:hypothetical protein
MAFQYSSKQLIKPDQAKQVQLEINLYKPSKVSLRKLVICLVPLSAVIYFAQAFA